MTCKFSKYCKVFFIMSLSFLILSLISNSIIASSNITLDTTTEKVNKKNNLINDYNGATQMKPVEIQQRQIITCLERIEDKLEAKE